MCRPTSLLAQSASARPNCRCSSPKTATQDERAAASAVSAVQINPLVSQQEALDFSGRSLWQAVDKFNPARILPRTDRALHMNLELFIERPADIAFFLIFEHDKCFWLDQAVIVFDGHDGGLENLRMANQCVLDLERRYPNAADLEHIVSAAAEGVHAIRTPHVFVTGAGPLAHKRAARFLTLIPVAGRGRFAAHPKLADFSVSNILPSIVNQPEVVTVHRHAGCTVLHGIRKVGQKKMPHLGRADAVDDVDTELLLPGFTNMDWQRLAGREAESYPARHVFWLAVGIGKHCGIKLSLIHISEPTRLGMIS